MLTLLEIETARLIRRRKNGTLQRSYLLEITISKVMFARSSSTWAPALEWFCVHTIAKGLFTWKWGTPGRWGNPLWWVNPPVHIITHLNLITVA